MDIFKNETGKLEPPHGNVTIKAGVAFATDQDMYFVAKWNELLGRYNAARLFLRKTQEEDWDYWFMRLENEDFQKAAELYIKSNLYETWIGKEEYPSDIRDVQKIISLEDGIKELIDFDDNILFPYIERLIEELKIAVNPSPMAYM